MRFLQKGQYWLIFCCLWIGSGQLFTQMPSNKKMTPTQAFTIEGAVKKKVVVSLDSIRAQPAQFLDSLQITNHLGEKRSTLQSLKVVSLLHFLDKAEFKYDSPKQLSEFYFIMQASDGYKVVFSWNELYNNTLGEGVFIVAEKNGKPIGEIEERISICVPSDKMTGRRYVKNLQKIIVKRIGQP